MKVVILAGGLGSRLSEETGTRPKPMVEVGGKPMIWHIMNIYAHYGLNDFIVCAGYKGYVLKEYFANMVMHHSDFTVDLARNSIEYHTRAAPNWRVTVVDTGADSMTGGRLRRVRRYLDPDEPFCMTYGDGVGNVDIVSELAFHKAHGRKATMCAVVPPARYGALDIQEGRIMSFSEKPKTESGWVNAGYFILDPSVVDLIEGDDTIWERGPLETLASEGNLMAYKHDGFWQPMDTLREKTLLDQLWESGKAPWKVWE